MLIECPECRSVCDIDIDADSDMTCPSCGHLLSTDGRSVRDFRPAPAAKLGDASRTSSVSPLELTATHLPPIPAISGYEIRRVLGEGGFARVLLAYDSRLDREVAIKVRKHPAATTSHGWLNEEARVAARLRHPNILHIYDILELPDGGEAVVMEYVDGPSLRDVLRAPDASDPPLSVERAVELMIQVAEATHYAHTKGLVHRDLKPGNILLDSSGRPRIADFGLALHESDQYRHAGEVAGTMPYMAPEQIRGETQHLDGRCDIWALGAVLYELLAGRRPFLGSRQELREGILLRPAKPLRQVNDAVPEELERIVLRCLEKEAGQRYSTALDVAQELRQWLQPAPAVASGLRRPTAPRARYLAWSALAVALLAVIGLAVSSPLLPHRDAAPQREPIVPQYELFRDTLHFTRHKWTPLLDQPPQRFMWFDSPQAMWNYDAERELLLTASQGLGMLAVGRAEWTSYRLQVTLVKSAASGFAGIFFGSTPVATPEGRRWHGQMLFVQLDERQTLRRRTAVYLEQDDGLHLESFHEFVETDIPPFGTDEHVLEMEVRGNTVYSVKWDGREMSDLSDRSVWERLAPHHQTAGCTGVLGVMNGLGSTTFRDYRLMREAP